MQTQREFRGITILASTLVGLSILSAATPASAAWSGSMSRIFPFFWWLPTKTVEQPTDRELQTVTKSTPATASTPAAATPQPTLAQQVASILPNVKEPIISKAEAKENKSIVTGWLTSWDEASFQSFKNNLNVLTEVHPFVYTIGADGVSLVPDAGDWHKAEVMRLAKENGIKVIPTISGDVNYSDLMLNDPARQAAHVQEIIREIESNGYDGFDIDYEGFMNGYNRDVYASFMTDLAKELHARNKLVAIAIEAFNREQNWEALGTAVDRFMIMGYDYHAAKGPEVGPIGPASWLKEVVDYAATRVPREKIVLGLGTYGYSWISNGAQFVSEAVGYGDALAIAQEMGATIQRDSENTPYFSYNRGYGQRYLYFEDAMSTKPKLEVAKQTGIAGIAFWRFGTEDPAVWQAIGDASL